MNKKLLEAENLKLHKEILRLETSVQIEERRRFEAEQRITAVERGAAAALGGLHSHVAVNSAGKPVCIGSDSDEVQLAVNVYRDEEGLMRGVQVTEGPDTLGWFGWIPAEVLTEELEVP